MIAKILILFLASQIGLHEALDKSIEARSDLTSFELEFKSVRHISQRSNSEDVYEVSATVESTGTVKFDQLSGLVFVRQRDELLRSEGKPPSFVNEFRQEFVYGDRFRLITENGERIWKPESGVMVSRPRDTAPTYRDLPFYLHAFGLATMYDASKKTPLEQIGLELKALRRNQAAYFTDGIAEFRMGSYLLEIDTKRGYWPIHQSTLRTRPSRIAGGRPTMEADESCDLELVKVNDTWVPARAKLQAKGRSQTFEFTWKTVNETVDPDKIDIEKVIEELTESYKRDVERYEASKQRDVVPK